MASSDYSDWNPDQIIAKVQALERDLEAANAKIRTFTSPESVITQSTPRRPSKPFNSSKYSTRLIALKFAYLGRNYHGLEYTAGSTTLQPTIEEVLWAALMKARLIFPTNPEAIAAGRITWEGCGYSKCGRTDKGVSAFGQVIGIRVRSNRPLLGKKEDLQNDHLDTEPSIDTESVAQEKQAPFDPIKDELPYLYILNQLLPSDIRALAWCSDLPADFSARFSCRERRYRYFFTNPAFAPTSASPSNVASRSSDVVTGSPRREGWLDIAAMQDAAKRYQGLHDFRNLCKLDSSKQLTDHRRRIYHSEIRELGTTEEPAAYIAGQAFSEFADIANINGHLASTSPSPKVYQFVLHGSAFLWHQVRHMVAVLFLVGQGLESPDIVTKLMDVKECPQKPHYEMADDAPLVLWDCVFPDLNSSSREDAIKWIYADDEADFHKREGKGKYGSSGLIDSLWKVWRNTKIDEVLAGSLLNIAAHKGRHGDSDITEQTSRHRLYLGGDSVQQKGIYTPLLDRPTGEHFEVVNARYAKKKGLVPKTQEELQQLRDARRDKRHDHLEDHVD